MTLFSLLFEIDLRPKSPVVVATKLEDIGEKVVALNHQILHNSIDRRIRHLNTWNWDITSILENCRNDNFCKILDQMRLERSIAVLIIAEIQEKLLNSITKSLVLRVLVELVGKEFKLIKDTVGMVPVALSEEEMTLIIQLVPLVGGTILKDVTLLLESLADEFVHRFEPVLELGVAISISINLVQCVKEIIRAGRIGETFDEGLEFCQRCFISFVST